MLCNECDKRKTCVEICSELQKHLKEDIEISRREILECELKKINLEEVKAKEDYPEGEIELNINDWKHLVKNYTMTKKQRRYVYLRYWKRLSLRIIGKKYGVSKQTVDQTIRRFIESEKSHHLTLTKT